MLIDRLALISELLEMTDSEVLGMAIAFIESNGASDDFVEYVNQDILNRRQEEDFEEPDDFDYTSIDYPDYDPDFDFFQREGRPRFPNEY
jgi:hypothetical protein